MPSYYVSSYSTNSITLSITPSGDYIYFKVYCRTEGGTEIENTWIAATATRNYTIYGLSAGTTYVINVGYHTNATDGTCTWMGSQTVTTSGGSGGGGTGEYYYYAAVSFDANGGSGAPSTVYGESLSSSVYLTIPYVQPTRDGYVFLGWSGSSDSTEATRQPGDSVPFLGSTTGYNYYTLYAVWQSETKYWYINIAYNDNGGSGGPGTYIYYGTNTPHVYVTMPTKAPTRDGYTFDGWSSNTSGTDRYYPGQSYYFTSQTADYPGTGYTLYAIWQKGGGKVRIYSGGWTTATPYIWYNGQWVKATPYIYSGGWQKST